MRRSEAPLFLNLIARFERILARVLALLLIAVLATGTVQLGLVTLQSLVRPEQSWLGGGLLQLLDDLLLLLIGLEVLQNVTAYLRDHSIHTELVLLTAITAVARKVIVMPPGHEKDPLTLIGVGVVILCMAAAFLLIRNHTDKDQKAFVSRSQDDSAPRPKSGLDDQESGAMKQRSDAPPLQTGRQDS